MNPHIVNPGTMKSRIGIVAVVSIITVYACSVHDLEVDLADSGVDDPSIATGGRSALGSTTGSSTSAGATHVGTTNGGASNSGGSSSLSSDPFSGGSEATGGLSAGGLTSTGGMTAAAGTGATGGSSSVAGAPSAGGTTALIQPTGGTRASGGFSSTAGAPSTGGTRSNGGTFGTGGNLALTGGATTMGGTGATGGVATGGAATGGAALTGGAPPTGGLPATGGKAPTGGAPATGGATSTVCTPVQLLVDPNFEDLSPAWVTDTTGIITNVPPETMKTQSGSYLAWLGGYANADDRLSQTVALSADFTGGTFSYYYRIATHDTSGANDSLWVGIESTSGSVTLASYSNLDPKGAWTLASFTIPASYAGQTIVIVFAATTNDTDNTNFVIDTVSLTSVVCG